MLIELHAKLAEQAVPHCCSAGDHCSMMLDAMYAEVQQCPSHARLPVCKPP
jgi:hypothetical protein